MIRPGFFPGLHNPKNKMITLKFKKTKSGRILKILTQEKTLPKSNSSSDTEDSNQKITRAVRSERA